VRHLPLGSGRLGYERLRSPDTNGAIEVMRFNVSAYSVSPNVYPFPVYGAVGRAGSSPTEIIGENLWNQSRRGSQS
jgi:hypothetical protein